MQACQKLVIEIPCLSTIKAKRIADVLKLAKQCVSFTTDKDELTCTCYVTVEKYKKFLKELSDINGRAIDDYATT